MISAGFNPRAERGGNETRIPVFSTSVFHSRRLLFMRESPIAMFATKLKSPFIA
jgi:hypothetical protein